MLRPRPQEHRAVIFKAADSRQRSFGFWCHLAGMDRLERAVGSSDSASSASLSESPSLRLSH
eukprot:2900065-Rhodomonas_salina.4